MKRSKCVFLKGIKLLLVILLLFCLSSCKINNDPSNDNNSNNNSNNNDNSTIVYTYDVNQTKSKLSINEVDKHKDSIKENDYYYDYLDVVYYIHFYHHLPSNFLTKNEAKELGWKGSGNLWINEALNGRVIGGDVFYNREEYLPIYYQNVYRELDANYHGGSRGSDRIVYNVNTFDIYYSDDHYNNFIYMIGEINNDIN